MLTHVSRLSIGLKCPDGSSVSNGALDDFIRDTLSVQFPDGFTVYRTDGGWRDATTGETIREPSVVIEIAHDGSDEALGAIRIVATTYKVLFHQDAVMVTTLPASVEFI